MRVRLLLRGVVGLCEKDNCVGSITFLLRVMGLVQLPFTKYN